MLLITQPAIPEKKKKKKEAHLQHQLIFTNSTRRPWLRIPSSGKSTSPVSKFAQRRGNILQLFFLISLILCYLCFPDQLTTFFSHTKSTQLLMLWGWISGGCEIPWMSTPGIKPDKDMVPNYNHKVSEVSAHSWAWLWSCHPTSPCLVYSGMQGSLMD